MIKRSITAIITLALAFIFSFTSCQDNSTEYQVSGSVENAMGDKFYISYEKGDSVFIDTINIDNGKFSFRGEVTKPSIISLYFNENSKSTFIFVDKGWNVKIKGNLLFPDLLEIKGGDINNDLTDFKNKNKELLISRSKLLAEEEDRSNKDSLSFKNYVLNLKNINFELSNLAEAYIQTNSEKIASVILLDLFFRDETSVSRLEENIKLLKGAAAEYPLTQELKNYAQLVKKSAIGAKAPSFSEKELGGKEVSINDFKGKYILLSFVSTTCHSCIEEKHDAVKVYEEMKKNNKNIEFVSIVKDTEQKALTSNITDSVKWHILPVSGGWSAKTFKDYRITEIPYNILISPLGTIVERNIHILALPQKFDEHIKKGNI